MSSTIKCAACGKFVSHSEMGGGGARFHFEPSSHFGPEVSDWECASCVRKETAGTMTAPTPATDAPLS